MLKDKIIYLCHLNKISVRKLSIALDVSEPTLYRWFRDDSMDLKYLRKIATYFKVDIVFFLDQEKFKAVHEKQMIDKIDQVMESSGIYGKDTEDLKNKYIEALEDLFKLQRENAELKDRLAWYDLNCDCAKTKQSEKSA